MPLDVTVDNARRLILMRGSGMLSDADLAAVHQQIQTNQAADPSFGRICDLSALTDVCISDESLASGWPIRFRIRRCATRSFATPRRF
jgi:hypothetical protein